MRLVAEARARGVDVTCETCPHYLALDEDDAVELGMVAKCSPPLRPREDVEDLWRTLLDGARRPGRVGPLAKPARAEAGARTRSPPGAGSPVGRRCSGSCSPRVYRAGSRSRRSRRSRRRRPRGGSASRGKGSIEPGADADLVIVDLASEDVLRSGELLSRHRLSPFLWRSLRGRIDCTIVRGCTVALDRVIVAPPAGRMVRPARTSTEARP